MDENVYIREVIFNAHYLVIQRVEFKIDGCYIFFFLFTVRSVCLVRAVLILRMSGVFWEQKKTRERRGPVLRRTARGRWKGKNLAGVMILPA